MTDSAGPLFSGSPGIIQVILSMAHATTMKSENFGSQKGIFLHLFPFGTQNNIHDNISKKYAERGSKIIDDIKSIYKKLNGTGFVFIAHVSNVKNSMLLVLI